MTDPLRELIVTCRQLADAQADDAATEELLTALDELYPLPDDEQRVERAGRTAFAVQRWMTRAQADLEAIIPQVVARLIASPAPARAATPPDYGPAFVNYQVPPTIAMDEAFREPYCQGYRHALSDVAAGKVSARAAGEAQPSEQTKGTEMFKATIIVNGRERDVSVPTLTYRDVVAFAGFHGFPGVLSVTWSTSHGGGTLIPGASVRVTEGMVFNAYDTSNA